MHQNLFARAAVRIASNDLDSLSNVAYKTPIGNKVLIVANTSHDEQNFNIVYHNKTATAILKPRSVATYIWK